MPLSFFIGSHTPFNIQRFTTNLGTMLSPCFELHLITTCPETLSAESRQYFEVFGSEYPNSTIGESRALYSYLNNNSPDVLTQISRPPKHGTLVGLLAKRFGVPFIYRLSGDRFEAYKVRTGVEKPVHYIYNNIFGRLPVWLSDYCIALGSHGKQTLIKIGVPEEYITILPPATDSTRFQPDVSPINLPSVPNNRRVILFVGRIMRLKGIKTLESIIPKIVDRQQDVQFVLVGEIIDEVNIPSKYTEYLTIVGPVKPEQVPRYYSLADILVHPSLTESFPQVLVEALLTKTPVIARAVGDIPDITQNTFKSEKQLVNMISNIDNVSLDNGHKYTINKLSSMYREFYYNFTE